MSGFINIFMSKIQRNKYWVEVNSLYFLPNNVNWYTILNFIRTFSHQKLVLFAGVFIDRMKKSNLVGRKKFLAVPKWDLDVKVVLLFPDTLASSWNGFLLKRRFRCRFASLVVEVDDDEECLELLLLVKTEERHYWNFFYF